MRRPAAVILLALVSCTGSTSEAEPTTAAAPIASTTPTVGGWVEVAPMEVARSEHPAVVLGGEIVVLGGLVEAGVGRTGVTSSVEAYNPDTDTWRPLPDLPEPRHHGMAAVVGERLFFIGGYDTAGNPSAAIWELADEAWREGQPMPEPVAAGAAVTVDDAIHLVGGVPAGAFYRYDLAGDRWVVLRTPTTQREHVAAATLDGELWAIAGRWSGEIFATTEIYDPEGPTWRAGPTLSEPRSGFGATVSGGRIIVAGGEVFDPNEALATVEIMDSEGWQPTDSLPHGRHGNPLVALDGRVFLPGGSTRPAGVSNDGVTYRLDPG